MSRIRGENTGPELGLRRAMWALGLRYRLHRRIEGIKTDMVFSKARVVVFVDGCFWHRCPLHGIIPKTNPTFWLPKLERNVERDGETNRKLRKAGWKVMRFWEHEIEDSAERCASKIAHVVSHRISKPAR